MKQNHHHRTALFVLSRVISKIYVHIKLIRNFLDRIGGESVIFVFKLRGNRFYLLLMRRHFLFKHLLQTFAVPVFSRNCSALKKKTRKREPCFILVSKESGFSSRCRKDIPLKFFIYAHFISHFLGLYCVAF